MEEFFSNLGDNPLILAGIIVLLVVIAYAVLKKLFKIALFLLLLVIGALVWFQMTGTDLPPELEAIKDKTEQAVETVRDGLKKAQEAKDVLDKVGD